MVQVRNIIRLTGPWLVPLLLIGCALVPGRRERAPGVPPESAAQQLAWAEEAFQEGKLQEAGRRYEHLTRAFPRSPEATKALLRQGEIHFQAEQYEQGVARFQQVIERSPLSSDANAARMWLLRAYLRLDRLNDAVETGRSLARYLPQERDRAEAAAIVADARRKQGRYGEAVRWYARAYAHAEQEGRASLHEKVRVAAEHLEKESLTALLAEYPDQFPSSELHTRMAEVEMESGDLASARERLRRLVEERPFGPLTETWKSMLDTIREWLRVDMTAIGCLVPLSGRYQDYGDRVLRGLVMAVEDAGALAEGRDIRLIVRDSGGTAEEAAAAVRELVVIHRVAAIVGPLRRQAAEAAAAEAEARATPIIAWNQKEGLSQSGDYVFRDFLSNEQQTKALVEYSILGLGYKRFAILYPRDGYGKRLMHLFWDQVERLGGELRGVEVYEPSQTDFAEQIKKLVGLYYPRGEHEGSERFEEAAAAAAESREVEAVEKELEDELLPILDFDAIFIPDTYEKVGLIAPQLAYYDITGVTLLGTNLWHSPRILDMAAPYLEGAVFVDGFLPDSRLPRTRRFVWQHQDSFGEKPGYLEAQAYDTLRLVMEAVRRPGVVSRPQLREALLGIRALPGVTGTASVTSGGEVSRPPFLITIRRRKMREIRVDLDRLRGQRALWDSFIGARDRHRTEGSLPEER
jgi:ABC-type branched-subunit amino acid transport system substrate-binding protein/predicted negative regulator of RcsB-dependent stress response